MASGALNGLRVIDLSEDISGPYCTRLLAGLGAEVIKVEPPAGDVGRRAGPFPADTPHHERGGRHRTSWGRQEQGITLDFTTRTGRRLLRRLLDDAHVLVEPGPSEKEALGLDGPALARSPASRRHLGQPLRPAWAATTATSSAAS
ncbi:MAG: CoA transferase [Dehalococcoidia bacterium]